jgi:adenylate cyclase
LTDLKLPGFLDTLLTAPEWPSKWNRGYRDKIVSRSRRRISVLQDRIHGITAGRVMPDRDDLTIGSGKRFELAVLFLDLCRFSARPNWTSVEQDVILGIMNVFMAEMLSIVKDFGGTYEKNTGDGLMAYFGEGVSTTAERVRPAVEAAVIMHHFNDHLLTPWLEEQKIETLSFRIGIDVGPVTIARVGIKGEESSRVAIGTTANIASKLMNRIPDGGICVGDEVYRHLPRNWSQTCWRCAEDSGFVYVATQAPYPAWELRHRLMEPLL